MTKKIVALLLVIATLCLPFCGLADDIPKTVDGIAEWLLSGDIDWIPMDVEINESLNDWLVIGWLSEYNAISIVYKGQTYSYLKNWAFTADDKTYTEAQVKMLVIQLALKGANE